ncbi:MAG TPA: recombinase family protein [Myxococcota bacterium]|nr:recombinase family protein [Myxococcota bacterium]
MVVTKLDRLARSVRHLVNLVGELEEVGVALVVLDQRIEHGPERGSIHHAPQRRLNPPCASFE